MQPSTAGLARSGASRPCRVVLLRVGLLVVSFDLMGGAGLNLSTDIEFLNNPDSKQGDQILADKFNLDHPPAEIVIVDDPAFQAVVAKVMDTLNADPDLIDTDQWTNYLLAAGGNTAVANQLISADRHPTLAPVTYNVEDTAKGELVVHAIDAISVEGLDVLSAGDVSIAETVNTTGEEDLQLLSS